jgi:tetratricopeptide (TPR) repeat protein
MILRGGKFLHAFQHISWILLFLTGMPPVVLADSALWQAQMEFKDDLQPLPGHAIQPVKKWTAVEKQQVMLAAETAHLLAPGLVQRVTAYRPLQLFRVDSLIADAFAMVILSHHGLYVSDRLFDPSTRKPMEDTLIHEWAHLVDPAWMNETDPVWVSEVAPRMHRVRAAVREMGGRYFDASVEHLNPVFSKIQGRQFRHLALREGMPALYACTNMSESLAVSLERRIKGYQPSKVMDVFLQERYLGTPYQPDRQLAKLHHARALQIDGQGQEAVRVVTEIIESHPRFHALYLFRAQLHRAQREWNLTVSDLTKALEVFQVSSQSSANIHMQRAEVYARKGELAAAAGDITQAIELTDQNKSQNYVSRAKVWKRMREFDHALADLTRAIDWNPRFVRAYRERATLWRLQKEAARELDDWNRVLELDPQDLVARRGRASNLQRTGQHAAAIQEYTVILQGKPGNRSALAARAALRKKTADFSGAILDYQSLAVLSPQMKSRYDVDRGRCLVRLGHYLEALDAFEQASEERENYHVAYQERAWLLATCADASIRDGLQAVALAEKAFQLTANRHRRSVETLAAAWAERGDFQQAVQWQTKVVQLLTDPEAARLAKKRLKLYQQGRPFRQAAHKP